MVSVHSPIHARWLNQIEIYFSIFQRKVLTLNDFPSLVELQQRPLNLQDHYQQKVKPFLCTFNRRNLADILGKLDHRWFANVA